MNPNSNTHPRIFPKKYNTQMKPYPPSLYPPQMPLMTPMIQRSFAYPMKDQFYPPKFYMKNDMPIRKAVTVKVPTTPKRSEENKGVAMVSSPEVKVEFNEIDTQAFFPKNPMNMPLNKFEDIPTASTSTESLLSSNTTFKKNLVRSQDNLMPQPFMANPFMCFPMPSMMNNIRPNRKLSYGGNGNGNNGNVNGIGTGIGTGSGMLSGTPHKRERGITGLSSVYDNNNNKKPIKNFYNKFNSPNEQNENTNILEIQCQVGENDVRVFKLKKYDDLFTSLQQFIDMNQIRQDLIQPIANKIFTCLNKIFWLCNNKVGQYDQGYLLSLYRVWKKNKENIPKVSNRNIHQSNSNGNSNGNCKEDEANKNKDKTSNANANANNANDGIGGSHSFNFYEELTEESIGNKNKLNRSV